MCMHSYTIASLEKVHKHVQENFEILQQHDASIGAAAVGKKSTAPDKAALNSEEIKPVAIAFIELRLPEGISKEESQSVMQSCSQQKIQLNRKF